MDINSAELQVKRLLSYVEDIASSSHKMYGKSKTRLKDVAATCSEVVRIIYTVLEDESLSNMEETEFAQSANPDLAAVLNDMQAELDRLKSFAALTPAVSNTAAVSNDTRRQVLINYSETLKGLADAQIPIPIADQCAQLLYNWFTSRFMNHLAQSDFHYNIKRLPDWLRDIVIVYGHSVATDNEENFISKFNYWCTSVQTESTNTYAVPYFIYTFNRYHDPAQFTLTAAVLWDILLDNGLSKLCTGDDDLYPFEDSVYRLCGQYSPTTLDKYCDYKLNSKLLRQCKLIKD